MNITYKELAKNLHEYIVDKNIQDKKVFNDLINYFCEPKDNIPVYLVKKFNALNTKDFVVVANDFYLTALNMGKINENTSQEYLEGLIKDCYKLK